ncbi:MULTISPECIES: hypothetical protein [Kitasatospora]|uniref:hypothetical protein n=1 Tax=Kitasatospora TaxID=2063 RepID=UPI0031D8402E
MILRPIFIIRIPEDAGDDVPASAEPIPSTPIPACVIEPQSSGSQPARRRDDSAE